MPMHNTKWWWRFDPALLVILLLFVAFEIVAHFNFHNSSGWYTLSNRITTLIQSKKFRWPARFVVYGGLIVLGIHFWGVF